METVRKPRSIPAVLGLSVVAGLIAAAMSFFVALFLAIVVFLVIAYARGTQQIDMTATYRTIAMPVGLAGLLVGFFYTLLSALRQRRAG